jgi:hypothetical protein
MREEFDISVCTQHAGDLLYVTHSRTHAPTHSRTRVAAQLHGACTCRYVPNAWHHATINLAETVGLSWREQFMESAPSLEVAAAKWAARKRRGDPIRPRSRSAAEDEAGASDKEGGEGAHHHGVEEKDGEELSGGVVFDLWLSDTELMEAAQRAEVSLGLERRDSLEAAIPTREEMIAKLEARRKKSK